MANFQNTRFNPLFNALNSDKILAEAERQRLQGIRRLESVRGLFISDRDMQLLETLESRHAYLLAEHNRLKHQKSRFFNLPNVLSARTLLAQTTQWKGNAMRTSERALKAEEARRRGDTVGINSIGSQPSFYEYRDNTSRASVSNSTPLHTFGMAETVHAVQEIERLDNEADISRQRAENARSDVMARYPSAAQHLQATPMPSGSGHELEALNRALTDYERNLTNLGTKLTSEPAGWRV